MGTLLKGVFPISLRTPFMFIGLNRLTQLPATCHVAPTHVTTFDQKTYNYQMNDCFHLLFRDCTEKIPVAVMARNLQGVQKEVKILAGVAEVLMTPTSATDMRVQLTLNGQQQIVQILPADLKTPERCIMSRPRFAAYSYMIKESCQGIPSHDLSKYQQEKTRCIKQEIIPTTL